MLSLSPFRRLRLRSNNSTPVLPSSSEQDSDESSPERDRPRVIHVAAPKYTSGECPMTIPDDRKISRGAPDNLTQGGAHIALTLAGTSLDAEQPPTKPSKSGVASDPVAALQPSAKPTLIRRVTSKLNISIPSRLGTDGLRSRPSIRTLPEDMKPPTQRPRLPGPTIAVSPTLPNSFVSKEHREAALRERGLLPPRKDYSEQEREADNRLGSVPSPVTMTFGAPTEAEQLKASWLAKNRTSESSDSDCGPPTPPSLQSTATGPQSLPSSAPPPDADVLRTSSEGDTDLPCAGKPSLCSSLPPLTTSYLEVLHEDPSEQEPITPPAPSPPTHLAIVVSGPLDYPSSPIIVESPVSCDFSSHCPGSTLESQSRSEHPPAYKKENVRSPCSRSRTSEGDRPRKVVGASLSKLGTRSLSNLRRSITESLGRPSTSTLSSVDLPNFPVKTPRTAISPTIHNLESIFRETRDIADAESRRLCELAFLD